MARPIIAVAWPKRDYLAALDRAGAAVRELTADANPLPRSLDTCDGVLLTGGPDVDPGAYGETERHPTVEIDPVRDRYELELARVALARDVPIFAICRGVQVLNVAAGGTLIQDIPSHQPGGLAHSVAEPRNAPAHDVAVKPGTCLSLLLAPALTADGRIGVNSRHHQSIRTPAPGFVVSATAPDGVVEAVERPASRFCLGVQWHPENFWESGKFSSLFEALVEAAERYHKTKAAGAAGL